MINNKSFQQKQLQFQFESNIENSENSVFSNHNTTTTTTTNTVPKNPFFDTYRSHQGYSLYPYQRTGAEFLLNCQKGLILDPPRLGKTPQALAVLSADPENALPALIITPKNVITQWQIEFDHWFNNQTYLSTHPTSEMFEEVVSEDEDYPNSNLNSNPKIIYKGRCVQLKILNQLLAPYDNAYIATYTFISRYGKDLRFLERLKNFKFKSIIFDEVQRIGNHETQAAKNSKAITEAINPNYIIGLSGTPINNSPTEFFPILNILGHAKTFGYNAHQFETRFITKRSVPGTQYTLKKLYDPEEFRRLTAPFTIRRSRQEVLPDLPKVQVQTEMCDIADLVVEEYDLLLTRLQEEIEKKQSTKDGDDINDISQSIFAIISRMRLVLGLSKIEPLTGLVEEFLTCYEQDKMLIFGYHHEVIRRMQSFIPIISQKHGLERPMILSSGDPDIQSKIKEFHNNKKHRVMILPMVMGTGITLFHPSITTAIVTELQWNPNTIIQALDRLVDIRADKNMSLTGIVMAVKDTLDEYMLAVSHHKTLSNTEGLEQLENNPNAIHSIGLLNQLYEFLKSRNSSKFTLTVR